MPIIIRFDFDNCERINYVEYDLDLEGNSKK